MKFYCQQAMGWKNWTNIVGLRADEPSRVAKIGQNRDVFDVAVPLARAGITRRDVADFWSRQNFDLELPNVDGNTAMGNCDLCFLKPASTIMGILRTEPWRGEWWAEQEARARASKPDGALFRKDRPSYAKMMQAVADQQDFGFGDLDERQECFCHD
jgi:3'-phosphoadenosine 5'-phosphosulfate sulfotransferase (PAPS reductase)/FAD synthetase